MEPVGVQVSLGMEPVGGHGVKAQNGKVLVEDPHDQNGKPRGQNGKEHEGDAKDGSEGTESEDSRHICEDDQLVADERNGLGHGTEEEDDDQDLETEEEQDEVETADILVVDEPWYRGRGRRSRFGNGGGTGRS